MVNLDSITLEDIKERHAAVDPKIREVIDSGLFTDRVSEISSLYNFDIDDAEELAFHKLVGITALGFITPDELPEAILMFIKTDKETAMAAAEEVKKILPTSGSAATIKPIVMAGLPPKQTQAAVSAPTPPAPATPAPAPQPSTPAAEPIRPGFGPGRAAQMSAPASAPNAPFVIHSNEEVKSNVSMDAEARGTVRPVFYKPVSTPKPADYSRPQAVRVDVGGSEVNPQGVPAKTINYTAHTPKTQTNPAQTNIPPKVDPENVVDLKVSLKDLPK